MVTQLFTFISGYLVHTHMHTHTPILVQVTFISQGFATLHREEVLQYCEVPGSSSPLIAFLGTIIIDLNFELAKLAKMSTKKVVQMII